MKKTLVVNLFGGPGSGKSTIAADLFSKLKWEGVDCELVTEYAKDLVWEERHKTFEDQIYIFGKQHYRLFRLIGKVDVILTDSPILLSCIYDIHEQETLHKLVIEEYRKCLNLSFFIERTKVYNPNGRKQNKQQAIDIDNYILKFLNKNDLSFYRKEGTCSGVIQMMELIKFNIENRESYCDSL